MPHTTFDSPHLDLDAYLARTGHTGSLKPTADTLAALHHAHATSIPYENLDILLGRTIALDVRALQDKLVHRRRGGYCFEHNLLFAAVLERLGFRVTGLGARVRMGYDHVLPATHMVLAVEADGTRWLADVGFGCAAPLEPLPIEAGAVSAPGPWRHRLTEEKPGTWVLSDLGPGSVLDLYSFTHDERFPVDYAVASHYTSTHPDSPFTHRLLVQSGDRHARRVLIHDRLDVTHPDHGTEHRHIAPEALARTLAETFGIDLPPHEAAILTTRRPPTA